MSNTAIEFMRAHKLSFRAIRVAERTDGLGEIMAGPQVNENWAKVENERRRHWRITLTSNFTLVTFFSQGSALTETPTASEVLECLASDARSVVDSEDVLDFASEFGWELDSPEQINHLRKVFAGCNETLDSLIKLLGEDGLHDLLSLDFDEEGS